MKTAFVFSVSATLGLLLIAPATLRAGSAAASDGHGGYGYAYGSESAGELRAKAFRNCQRESRHPAQVKIIFQTGTRGHGVILRYYVRGEEHIAASGGFDSPRAAYRHAERYAEGQGASKWEVADTWLDE